MEAGGAALWRSPATSGARIRPGCAGDSSSSSCDGRRSFRISARPSGVPGGGGGGFSDEGYLKYYVSLSRCGGSKKEEKKRAKLVKGLARDLPMFYYSMSFGLEAGEGLAGEVQGKMISVRCPSYPLSCFCFIIWMWIFRLDLEDFDHFLCYMLILYDLQFLKLVAG